VGIPVPTKKLENKLKFGENTELRLIEWEKNQVKPLFREYDKDKKGIQKEKLIEIMSRLAADECIIGKVPNVEAEVYEQQFTDLKLTATGAVTWEVFREALNNFPWKMMDPEQLNEIVDDYFARAQRAKMQGKDAEWKDLTTKALRLQGSMTKTKPVVLGKPKAEEPNNRTDTFARTIHRRKNNMHPDEVYGDCTVDKTLAHTFKV
jgi:hypothetical protein